MAAAAGACSAGSKGRAVGRLPTVPATTSTVPAPTTEPSTTVAPAATVTTTAPSTPIPSSPEDQARALYEAWTRNDRATAATLADADAVTMLFARTWSAGDGWSFSECSGAAGSVICAWDRVSEQLLLRVENANGALPVTVSEVRFAS